MTVRSITVWRLAAAGRSGVRIAAGAVGLSRLEIIQTCTGVHRACCSVGAAVKRPGHEAGRSSMSSAEVKDDWSYTSTPPIRLHDVDSEMLLYLITQTHLTNPSEISILVRLYYFSLPSHCSSRSAYCLTLHRKDKLQIGKLQITHTC